MRDVERLKEKIELTLDNRQVVSLVIGSLIVLGLVFLLGIMVGKQAAGPVAIAASTDVLAVLDQKALNPPPKVAPKPIDPPFTYQTDLPAPSPVAPVVAPAKAEPKPEPKSELVPEHAKLVPPPAAAKEAKEAKEENDEEKPEPPAKVAAPKPEPKADPTPAPHVDGPPPALDQKLAAAFTAAKAKQAPKSDEAPPAAAPTPTPKPGTYTVQVAASQQKSDADQVMSKLRGSGLRPYQVNAEIPGRGLWYRVRVGNFPSRGDAEKYAGDLKRETGMTGFVTAASQ